MEVVLIKPQGYCGGVSYAIKKALDTAKDENSLKPIFILGMLVHNSNVVEMLSEHGVITLEEKGKSRLELIDNIESGTVIFTAHGTSDIVKKKAIEKHLNVIDCTCKYVKKIENIIKMEVANEHQIIYIGKKNHPEAISAKSIDEQFVSIIENIEDFKNITIFDENFLIITQTTLSILDSRLLIDQLKTLYPNARLSEEICSATRIRQEAIINMDSDIDFLIVVGDHKSNNTNKLKEIGIYKLGQENVLMCESLAQLDVVRLENKKKIAITSGASTPADVTLKIYDYIKRL